MSSLVSVTVCNTKGQVRLTTGDVALHTRPSHGARFHDVAVDMSRHAIARQSIDAAGLARRVLLIGADPAGVGASLGVGFGVGALRRAARIRRRQLWGAFFSSVSSSRETLLESSPFISREPLWEKRA